MDAIFMATKVTKTTTSETTTTTRIFEYSALILRKLLYLVLMVVQMACIKSRAYAVMITVANKCTVTRKSQNFLTAASCLRNYLTTHSYEYYCLPERVTTLLPQTYATGAHSSLYLQLVELAHHCLMMRTLYSFTSLQCVLFFGIDNIIHLNLNSALLNITLINVYIYMYSGIYFVTVVGFVLGLGVRQSLDELNS